jgi:hypothetical protein
VLVYKESIQKEGFNPVTGQHVVAERSTVAVENDLPLFTSPEGQELLRTLTGL